MSNPTTKGNETRTLILFLLAVLSAGFSGGMYFRGTATNTDVENAKTRITTLEQIVIDLRQNQADLKEDTKYIRDKLDRIAP